MQRPVLYTPRMKKTVAGAMKWWRSTGGTLLQNQPRSLWQSNEVDLRRSLQQNQLEKGRTQKARPSKKKRWRNDGSGKPVQERWVEIESKLSERVGDYLFENPDNPIPGFDSSESLRGCRIFKCRDEFSREFLGKCVAELGNAWEGLKFKLIPAEEVPRKPRARIWLPKMAMDSDKLIRFLQRQNPEIPMSDWVVIRAEKPLEGAQSSSYLLRLNEESIGPLQKMDNKLLFGVRTAKLKIFRSNEPIPEADIEDANQMLGDMNLKVTADEEVAEDANQVLAGTGPVNNAEKVDEGGPGKS
ncbi:PREDICTED: uncharacterized protein LOC108364687 [Rhagoletis zephyria]|uniref:uncharacterized protein LOC108364687 n=1 Tax=Rhagoletis zephyria TaxID=28612 RepID=UPI0008114AC2|nr:PREDICTED: uncharacterized protein LOC108364687 [Rhagoletis zephyria]